MTSKLTREENVQAVFDLKSGYTLGLADVEILKRVARMALAALDSEPVFILEVARADYKGQKLGNHFGFTTLDAARELKEGKYQLYRHALQPVVPDAAAVYAQLSDHEKWSTSLENVNHVLNAFRAAMLAAAPQEVKGE